MEIAKTPSEWKYTWKGAKDYKGQGSPEELKKLYGKFKNLRKQEEKIKGAGTGRTCSNRGDQSNQPPENKYTAKKVQKQAPKTAETAERTGLNKMLEQTIESALDKEKNITRLKYTISGGAYAFWMVAVFYAGLMLSTASFQQKILTIPLIVSSLSTANAFVLAVFIKRYWFAALFASGLIIAGFLLI